MANRKPVACILFLFVTLMAGRVSQAGILHHWRFEDSPGFLKDSIGAADLTGNAQASQIAIPDGARGQDFPSSIPGIGSNGSAADFAGLNVFSQALVATNSTSVTNDFTIELLYHPDAITGTFGDVLAGQASSANTNNLVSWALEVRFFEDFGTEANELMLAVSNGVTVVGAPSGIVLSPNRDYYVAASFDLSGSQATFHVQDLTSGTSLQSVTSSTRNSSGNPSAITSLNPNATFVIGDSPDGFDFRTDGLIDEVRFSNTVLSSDELLINGSSAVPEPSSFALLGMGILGLGGVQWRRKRKTKLAA